MEITMLKSWDTAIVGNDSQAWFVTKWPGKHAGAPEAELLFVVVIPQSLCLCAQLFENPDLGWEFTHLIELARAHPSPDVLATDSVKLQHVLVSVGSNFVRPASAYLDKPITLMPAVSKCTYSFMEVLNAPAFSGLSTVRQRNDALEVWRSNYNRRRNDVD
jgi:hypothetical protein